MTLESQDDEAISGNADLPGHVGRPRGSRRVVAEQVVHRPECDAVQSPVDGRTRGHATGLPPVAWAHDARNTTSRTWRSGHARSGAVHLVASPFPTLARAARQYHRHGMDG